MTHADFPETTHGSVAYLVTLCLILVLPLAFINHLAGKQVVMKASAQAKSASQIRADKVPSPAESNPAGQAGEQEQLEKVIKKHFGKDARVMIAIQKFECNSTRADYPKCTKWDQVEKSCGVMQINLDWHADKVKGDTLQEKCVALYDIDYNIQIAKKIFDGWQGFGAWTAYSNGRYLNEL